VEDALDAHRIDRAGRSRSVCSRVGSRCQEYALPSSSAQAGREWVNASSASSVRARHAVREISPFGRCPFAPPDLLRRSAVNQKFLGGHVRPGPPSRAGRVGSGSGAIRVSQGWQVSKSPRTDPGTPATPHGIPSGGSDLLRIHGTLLPHETSSPWPRSGPETNRD
jgi:hypothetical protein